MIFDSAEDAKSPAWLKRIVRLVEHSEEKLPEPEFMRGELPDWVQNVSRELLATLFPVAKLKRGVAWTPGEVGALIGHKLAYCHALMDIPRPDTRIFKKLDNKVVARVRKQARAFIVATEDAIQKALCVAVEQRYSDSVSFFAAFSKALAMKPADAAASNFHRTNTKVYWLLLRGWKSVQYLRTVRDLQQALCRYLEPHMVGNVKRIEKMCQRLDLHLGRRGRPRNVRGLPS